jgi:quercetin dioxygenase-like cupin family protein
MGQIYQVSAGDVVFIPEAALHWYQFNGDEDFKLGNSDYIPGT